MDIMKIESSRFGTLELDDSNVINFPAGIIGFPDERSFVLLRRRPDSAIAWLHSTTTSWLALPVVSADALALEYPAIPLSSLARPAGIETVGAEYAMMVVLNATSGGGRATVNLLAPLIVNAETRKGAQVLLEGSNYSTQEPFIMSARRPCPRNDTSASDRSSDSQASGVQAIGA